MRLRRERIDHPDPTPGPWHVDPPTPMHDFAVREGPGGFLIATVWHDDSRRERADAYLIAAAPEMAEYIRARAVAGCAEASRLLEKIDDRS